MNMQGMMFGGEGPVMKGTWYNVTTGDVFTVRDSFFEDNNYVVSTTDGRYLRYDQLKNYTQSDMPEKELKEMLSRNKTNNVDEDIPDSIKNILEDPNDPYSDYLLPEDNINSLGNISTSRQLPPVAVHQTPVNMNSAIIEKALKNASKPDFVVTVDWEEFPTKQIEMLKDVMDIPQDEIVEWYINNIDMSDVVESIKDSIRNRILGEEFHVLQERIKELSEITPKVEPVEYVQTEVKDFKKTKKSTTNTKRTTKVKS